MSIILKVEGMHCDSCKTLIEMELEENGMESITVDGDKHELIVPAELEENIEAIKAAVAAAGDYRVINT